MVTKGRHAVREPGRLLAPLADVLPLFVAYVNAEGRCEYHNSVYAEALRLVSNDPTGRRIEDVLGLEGYEKLRPHLDAVRAGRTDAFDASITAPDGDARLFRTTLTPDV